MHQVDVGAIDDKHSTRNAIGCSGGNAAVAVNRPGFEPPHIEPAALVTGAADEDAAAVSRRAIATGRNVHKVGADRDIFPGLHVPERQGALQNMDAVAVRALGLCPRISGDDIQPLISDMPGPHILACEDLHPSSDRETLQFDPP